MDDPVRVMWAIFWSAYLVAALLCVCYSTVALIRTRRQTRAARRLLRIGADASDAERALAEAEADILALDPRAARAEEDRISGQ
jgi:hypothetical protein